MSSTPYELPPDIAEIDPNESPSEMGRDSPGTPQWMGWEGGRLKDSELRAKTAILPDSWEYRPVGLVEP